MPRPATLRALAALLALSLPGAGLPRGAARPAARRAASTAAAPAAPASVPLSQVLARTFRLYGGVEAILAVEGVRLRGTVDEGGVRGTMERLLLPPGGYRAAITRGGVERETLLLRGGRAFRDGFEVTGLARADQIRLEAARAFLPAALARARAGLLDRGDAVRGALRVRVVELRLHEQASLAAEIDPESGRIVRAVTSVAGRSTAVTFGPLREVGGVRFPSEEELEAREGRRTLRVDELELVPASAVALGEP